MEDPGKQGHFPPLKSPLDPGEPLGSPEQGVCFQVLLWLRRGWWRQSDLAQLTTSLPVVPEVHGSVPMPCVNGAQGVQLLAQAAPSGPAGSCAAALEAAVPCTALPRGAAGRPSSAGTQGSLGAVVLQDTGHGAQSCRVPAGRAGATLGSGSAEAGDEPAPKGSAAKAGRAGSRDTARSAARQHRRHCAAPDTCPDGAAEEHTSWSPSGCPGMPGLQVPIVGTVSGSWAAVCAPWVSFALQGGRAPGEPLAALTEGTLLQRSRLSHPAPGPCWFGRWHS